jgi:hypothetical protein
MPLGEEFTRRSLFPRGEFESVMIVSASHLDFFAGRLATDFRLPRAAGRPLLADGEESVGGDSPSCGFGAGHGDDRTGSSIDERGDERVLLASMMSSSLPLGFSALRRLVPCIGFSRYRYHDGTNIRSQRFINDAYSVYR